MGQVTHGINLMNYHVQVMTGTGWIRKREADGCTQSKWVEPHDNVLNILRDERWGETRGSLCILYSTIVIESVSLKQYDILPSIFLFAELMSTSMASVFVRFVRKPWNCNWDRNTRNTSGSVFQLSKRRYSKGFHSVCELSNQGGEEFGHALC